MAFRKIYAGIVRDCFLGITTPQHAALARKHVLIKNFCFTIQFNPCRDLSTARFNVCYYLLKNFFRTYHFAPALCATKSTLQKQNYTNRCLLFGAKKIICCGSSNDSGLCHSQSDVQNTKAFSRQYTPKSKDQPFESDRTHFYVRLGNSNVAKHRSTFLFLLPHKITTIQQKTTKTKSHQTTAKSITKTTTSNNPQSLNQNSFTINNQSQ